jgi:hypothetical protein
MASVICVVLAIAGPTHAAQASATLSPLVAAGTGAMTDDGGVVDELAVVAYQTAPGIAHAEFSICDAALHCRDYTTDSAALSFAVVHTTVALTADITGVGTVSLTFTSNSGNRQAYECLGNTASFDVQGSDVESAVIAGTVGTSRVTRAGCGAWGLQAAVEYALL